MKHFGIIIAWMFCMNICAANEYKESVLVITDKDCYVTGECVNVSLYVNVCNGDGDNTFLQPSLSKVAYVEISDERKMSAQCMVALENGRGWANITLPLSMHSGNYQLTAYTNAMRNYGPETFVRKLISIVNPTKVSRLDKIEYMPVDSADSKILSRNGVNVPVSDTYKCGDSICMKTIGLEGCLFTTATLSRCDLFVPEYDSIPSIRSQRHVFRKYIPEYEGHIVTAKKIGRGDIDETRLVMVGKNSCLYDGMQQNDSLYMYFTQGLYGNLPTLINAYDKDGKAVTVEIQSPYANVLPQSLPKLTVYGTEEDLRNRCISAQKEKVVYDFFNTDSLEHSSTFMSTNPSLIYDLDEYTKFHTVREILIEFVKGVHKKKYFGVNKLFTFNFVTGTLSDWPSLVLLDGMPVHNIDDILEYDGHLLKYVQIYPERYTFGNSTVHGVISFISKKGRLSNFKIDDGSKFVKYSFPQYKPELPVYDNGGYGTIYWNPNVKNGSFEFAAPSVPGIYKVVCQGVDEKGNTIRTIKVIDVKN